MDQSQETERIQTVYAAYDASYRQRWDPSNPGNRAIQAERERRSRRQLERSPVKIGASSVLEIGCGSGGGLGLLRRLGGEPGQLTGLDLLGDDLRTARRSHPDAMAVQGAGQALPFHDESFDVVAAFTLFSSIIDPRVATGVAREAARVLRPGGIVLWYDNRVENPRNQNTKAYRRADVQGLFEGFQAQLEPVTVLPPVVRRLGRLTPVVYPALARLGLRTHLVGTLTKPGRSGD